MHDLAKALLEFESINNEEFGKMVKGEKIVKINTDVNSQKRTRRSSKIAKD